jgi:hypothetical protein
MKDLDFDELDRAVNSLMTNVPKSETSQPEETEKTLTIASTLGEDATPSFDTLNEATAKVTGSTPSPAPIPAPLPASSPSPTLTPASRPPLATRRGGRFMDVVHPSSDMKKPTIPTRPVVSRQGATIAPSSTAISNRPLASPTPSPQKQSTVVEVEPSTAASQSSVPARGQIAPANDWPDPLEMADFKDDDVSTPQANVTPEASVSKEVSQPEKAPQIEALLGAGEEGESSPLTSPFLSGTKVEKRPLGGSMLDQAEEPDRAPAFGAKLDDTTASTDPDSQLPATPPNEVESELPEELKGDLMAIEADTTTHKNASVPETSPLVKEEKKSEPIPASRTEARPIRPSLAPHDDEKLLTAGPTSIPQQYREEPNTGDKDNGGIYDTDSYHQPLAHPAKKKSGWLWVLWIVIILIIGAGGGAALYFFGIV